MSRVSARFFRDFVEAERRKIYAVFGFDADALAEVRTHHDERRVFNHLFGDARAALAEKDREIERLSFDRWQNTCDACKERDDAIDRATRAEARLAAMGAVTEADVEAACKTYCASYSDGRSRSGSQGMRAALNAFIASKRAAPDQPAEPERADPAPSNGWCYDMEKAPRDGVSVLVKLVDDCLGSMQVVAYDADNPKGNEWKIPSLEAWVGSDLIVAWTPLPAPPAPKEPAR